MILISLDRAAKLPLPAWGRISAIQASSFPPKPLQANYQLLRMDASTRLHKRVADMSARLVGTWFRERVDKVRIKKGRTRTTRSSVQKGSYVLQGYGERRSVEEDPEPRRNDGQASCKPGDPRHPLAHLRRGRTKDRQRLSLLRGGLLHARLPPRRAHHRHRGEPRQSHKCRNPLSERVRHLRDARLAVPLDQGPLPQAVRERVGGPLARRGARHDRREGKDGPRRELGRGGSEG